MSYSPANETTIGQFTEREHGNAFDYSKADDSPFGDEFGHVVWVGGDGSKRYANVKKTVAHIVVDEASDGSPVTERWFFRRHSTW